MRAPRICCLNQKGGAGKSSTVFHLAGHYAKIGFRVLLVDADPQGSLSQGFFGSGLIESLEPQETLAAIFRDDFFVELRSLPVAAPIFDISVIRANQHLAAFNAPTPENGGMIQFALNGLLDELEDYDIVLIDCPPNLYQCSWNAMLAADAVIIPVPPEDFGTQGLRVVHQAIENARALNPKLQLLGHLVTRYDRRLLVHETYHRKLRKLYGESVLRTVIPEASAFKVSLACRKPVAQYSPRSDAAKLTGQLADEISERLSKLTPTRKQGVA
jgi:chromosome partitioning protein